MMKATIENPLQILRGNSIGKLNKQFSSITNAITKSEDENDLRANMKDVESLDLLDCFKYGFGSNHMWVHQQDSKTGEVLKNRVIFVEL